MMLLLTIIATLAALGSFFAGFAGVITGLLALRYAERQDELRTDLQVAQVRLVSPQGVQFIRDLGTNPDKVVRVSLRNLGKATAYHVTGDVTFSPPGILEPDEHSLPFPGVLVLRDDGGPIDTVYYGPAANMRVRPEGRDLHIPVLVTGTGTVKVACLFSTPTGTPAEYEQSLTIP